MRISRACRIVVAAALLNTAAVHARTIVAEGLGYSRETAVRNALRNAVEQGAGMQIGSQTLVENAMVVADRILSHTEGFVSRYSVLSERREFGLVAVSVSAQVEMGRLQDSLVARKLLYELVNQPRIMVVLDERIGDREMFERTASYKLEEALKKQGYKVVDPAQYRHLRESGRMAEMDDASLADSGFRFGADLLIRGAVHVAEATPLTLYGTPFFSVPIQFNVKIVKADNAAVIATRTRRVKKNSQEEFSAAQFGLETGGGEIATELIKDLMEYWHSAAYNENEVTLEVSGMDDAGLRELEGLVRKAACVLEMRLRYIEAQTASYDVSLRGTVQDLREALGAGLPPKTGIAAVTAHRILLRSGNGPAQARADAECAVDLRSFTLHDIYPGRLGRYQNTPLAAASFTSPDRQVDDVTISILVPELMRLPSETAVGRLERGAEKRAELILPMNESFLMGSMAPRTLNGQLVVSYRCGGVQQKRSLTAPVTVYGRNAMDWLTPASLGGFVTFQDATVDGLVKTALRAVPPQEDLDRTLVQAMALFRAMERLGVRYVPDPAVRPGTLVLDKVQYPAETAAAKAGDCDDLAVLYAALLAGAGIRAAVISYPDHVLVMFDTGLFDKNRLALTADAKRAVVHQGRLWVPVETTMAGKGFLAAWKSAAADFHRAVEDGQRVSIIDLEAAWKEYPPAPVSLPPVAVGDLDLGKVLEADARALKEDGTEGIRACMAELAAAGLNGADALNRYGILAAALGRYDTALACFERAQASGGGAAVRNNRACALILAGDEKQALDELNKIYKEEKNGAAAVNRALCLYLGAVDAAGVEKFVAALKEASAIAGSTGRLARLLGIDLAPEEGVRAAGDRQEEKPQTVDRRRLKELIRKRVLEGPKAGGPAASVKSGVLPFGGVRGADPQQVAKVADLLFWIEEL